uniref:Shikimate O-hydroxycinnamoyltransferase-like n=1 Tax=Rhizophora mucronata TaxID=61149 RepID=A0A2P2NXZ9_RHIMU
MKVDIKETTIVRPSQSTSDHRLWLSALDLLYTRRGYVPLLFFYKNNGSSNFFDAKVLKEALGKVLVPYYPVAGRLVADEKGRIEISCNGEGALFIEAVTDSALADLGDFLPGQELQQLIPAPAITYSSDANISSYPLLLVQVTTFSCGGVSMGFGWHHNLADGTGFLRFIEEWSNIARGHSISNSNLPLINRTALRAQLPPTPIFDHVEYRQSPTMITRGQNPESKSGPKANRTAIFKVTLEQINVLKALTKSNQNKYSSFEVVCAHIWRTACKARGLSDAQVTRVSIVVNGRPRLQPPLPSSFFGNVTFMSTPIALSGDILSEPFAHNAERIHNAIKRMDDKYLSSAIDYVENLDDLALNSTMIGPGKCQCPNLSIPSWMRLPFHEVDFGWGRPICSRPANVYEGKGYVLSSPTNDGSLLLVICLEAKHMVSFEKLFHASIYEEHMKPGPKL